MALMNMIQALNSALDVKLDQDPDTLIFGEDVGYFGGVFRVTEGLQKKYGLKRCFDTPISEGGIIATAVGMGAYGLRPVVEIQFADYILPAFDQLISEAARLRYRSGGEFTAPITVRSPYGGGIFGGQTHSQSPEALFAHVTGLKTVIPSNPYDAKGLLIAAIRDDDPVIFMEHKAMYDDIGEVPDEAYTVPLGEGRVVREGDDVTVIAIGRMVQVADEAIRSLKAEGISCALFDPRSISPLDEELLLEMVEETGRVVIVDHGAGVSTRCRSRGPEAAGQRS